MKTVLLTLLILLGQDPIPKPAAPVPLASDSPSSQSGMAADYLVGVQDVLTIVVHDLDSMSRDAVTVESDGTVELPYIGRFGAKGLSLRALEDEVERRLIDGKFHLKPSVSVRVKDYRSQTITITGQVRQPGQYRLKGSVTVMQALGEAGHFTSDAGSYIIIAEAGTTGSGADAGVPREDGGLRVERTDLEFGRANHLQLKDGDTIIVPKMETFYVTGEVRSPNEYTMRPNLTVIQAITRAGGYNERAAKNRLRVERIVDGKSRKISVKESDLVKPGDTIYVPQRYW
jgi:polysaccharide export outer membrane protein